jgi:hypothetical protein
MADIAAVWRKITDQDKAKYVQMATEDKVRYEEEKKNAE